MNILIPKNISFRTYNFEKENSRTYITDEKFHKHHILENEASDIWYIIYSKKNLKAVKEYALHRDLFDLDDFIKELVLAGLIEINKNVKSTDFSEREKQYSPGDNNFESDGIYDKEKKQWIYNNGYLPSLTLQLTYRCNLKCIHCFNDKTNPDKNITYEEAKSAIDQAYRLGISEISITGGECTCNGDFLKICRYIRSKHLLLKFLTNGQTLSDDEKLFNEIANLYPHTVGISLYSMQSAIHDSITGVEGSWAKALDAIIKFKNKNIGLVINTPIIKINFQSHKEVLKFAKDNDIAVSTQAYFIDNPDNKNSHLKLSEKELIELYTDKTSPSYLFKNNFINEKMSESLICSAGTYQIALNPNRDITPCHDFNYKLGNLNTDSLSDIWYKKLPSFRKIFRYKNLQNCFNEEYCKYCVYCHISSNYKEGFMQRSYGLCENAKAYFESEKILRKGKK